ncbi:MAG: alpha/beta hydrolase [Paramuribaculum sp.]|nr:alpha/beta hydrolase [Paramuribaculum sp.]
MSDSLEIDGIKFHYEVSGKGAPMIIMHGWGCDSSTVSSITRVAEKTHRVYTIDFPGFGKSDEPQSVWGVDDYTKFLEKFSKQENISNPVLLGHSFGGRVGIVYASRNEVSKLILVDAAGIKPKRKISYYLKVYSFKASKFIMKVLYGQEEAKRRTEEARKKSGSSDYRNASPMMRAILSKVVNEDLKHLMPLIKAPTLLIWGENDTATPLADGKMMESLIPEGALVSFPGCGHYSFLDNPRQFAAVLESFLKS